LKLQELTNQYSKHKNIAAITDAIKKSKINKIHLKGLYTSASSLFLDILQKKINRTNLIILSNKEDAAYFFNDLQNIDKTKNKFYFLTSSYKKDFSKLTDIKLSEEDIISRTKIIENLSYNNKITIVSYPEAIVEKEASKEEHNTQSFQISKKDEISTDFLKEFLLEYGFTQKDFVFSPGEFSIRGSIFDIFSFSNEYPFRIDFFGDEVESIRTFDIVKQLSIEQLNSINIHPNVNLISKSENKISFFEHLPSDCIICANDIKYSIEKIDFLNNEVEKISSTKKLDIINKDDIINSSIFLKQINKFNILEFCPNSYFNSNIKLDFEIVKQTDFNKNFDLLAEDFKEKEENLYKNYILSDNQKQIERLESILSSESIKNKVKFTPIKPTLHEGFYDKDLRICCYTDHQIFKRYHRAKYISKDIFEKKSSISLKEINGLKPGDYVVHIDHGIGQFSGIQTIDVNGKKQETIRLTYKNNDTLFVSIHSLHKISKYKGSEGTAPKIYKLGSGAWQKLKNKTKSKVKDIAKDLINLYAKRKAKEGFGFSPDTYLQQALEASFIYEDTPDQTTATQAIKTDMESKTPMDRLVCGDVGFGKTEVAIRAAFKAVTDGKQVAILVPTTILSLQHYHTFRKRLKEFPCNVEYISRLKNAKEQKRIITELKSGKVDILIGTHRLISKDIVFKDLGLLVVDEEQKFGVALKEKLKQIKINVDTLTLTATPIPRTLQFSLMGARDLSIINTAPPDRFPIITELHSFNEEIIKNAIEFEIKRNGQVFFIHNRVQNIFEVEHLIHRICPNIKTVVGHGQMKGTELEKVMFDFINHEYDVLIATTIIESGVDIPNANTIIINNAQNFGLSDLHQLRGRVGRSDKKAFCYLIAPPLTAVSDEAKKRLKAVEEFTELGSGFNIAMRDLDIRGAGNLLGGEQSGFIADIGFETYQQILNEALFELKEENKEYKNANINTKAINKISSSKSYVYDCQIDTDFEILFSDNYIANTAERIKLYRELDNIKDKEALTIFENNLIDRFGEIPKESKELINVVELRWLAIKLGFKKIILKNGIMIIYFIDDKNSTYFNSNVFSKILNFIQQNPTSCNLKEKKDKLVLYIDDIKSVTTAFDLFKNI